MIILYTTVSRTCKTKFKIEYISKSINSIY